MLFNRPPNIESLQQRRDIYGLLKALHHTDRRIQERAANALDELGGSIIDKLITAAFYGKSKEVRREALGRLQGLGNFDASSLNLFGALEYEQRNVLAAPYPNEVAGFLHRLLISGVDIVPALVNHLRDGDVSVRWWAAGVLGEIEEVRAVQPLIECLKDESAEVREASAKALFRIGGTEAERALEDGRLGD